MTSYYLTRQHTGQKYAMSTHRTTGAENIGPFLDYNEAHAEQQRLNAKAILRKKPAKPALPAPPPNRLLTRQEFGEAVYQAVKAEIESRGFRLWAPRFDPNYPCSLRTLGNIRKGIYDIETLRRLPGIRVGEYFTIEIV